MIEVKGKNAELKRIKSAPVKDEIKLKDLDKIDIRIGEILSVEDVEKSDKLVKLTVDFGEFKRIILCGMKKERENPREIEGRQALFVVNLAPREMFGITSQGMLFDIGYEDGIIPVLASPEKPVPNGVRAG
ncbi:MAG: tRNA-binding protein [Clostridiales bacterium]|nr:tRNA-binding protein [Clostridiales bacterium]MDD7347363.1 tRNA-binding protein [Clostridiales bacterium]MDY4060212.1 hypothetical protein [Anaerovoracaceae bacterium]